MIELAKFSDLDELEVFFEELNDFLDGNYYGPEWKKGIYPTKADAESSINEDSLYVYKLDNAIVGTISLNHRQESAYENAKWNLIAHGVEVLVIRLFAVHPNYFGQSIGGTILNFVKVKARELSCKTIRLDVVNQNIPACLLYEKHGFKYVSTVDLGLPYDKLKWFRLYEYLL